MKLRKMLSACLLMALMVGVSSQMMGEDKAVAKDGKTIFTEAKCSNCHAIASQNIVAKSKKDYPDLSTVGDIVKADVMKKYLLKEEALNGKKHLIAFKGDAAELDILASWLESLMSEPKK